jgi:hypothetical protein
VIAGRRSRPAPGLAAGQRRRRARDRREVLVDPGIELARIEVAGDDEGGVVRPVVGAVEGDDVGDRRRIEVLDAADHAAAVRMAQVGPGAHLLEEAAVGRGQDPLPVLLLHHRALGAEVGLVDAQVGEPLGLGPEQRLEMVRRHHRLVGGDVLAGEGVVLAADVLGEAVELLALHVLRALEHDVLEEMREARLAFGVVGAADVVPDLDADRRAGVALDRKQGEAVVELALAVDDARHLQRLGRGRGGGARRARAERAGGEAGREERDRDEAGVHAGVPGLR